MQFGQMKQTTLVSEPTAGFVNTIWLPKNLGSGGPSVWCVVMGMAVLTDRAMVGQAWP